MQVAPRSEHAAAVQRGTQTQVPPILAASNHASHELNASVPPQRAGMRTRRAARAGGAGAVPAGGARHLPDHLLELCMPYYKPSDLSW